MLFDSLFFYCIKFFPYFLCQLYITHNTKLDFKLLRISDRKSLNREGSVELEIGKKIKEFKFHLANIQKNGAFKSDKS